MYNKSWATPEIGRYQGERTFVVQQQHDLFIDNRNSKTNRAVQTQHDDHEEEDDGKKSSSRHI